MSEQIYLPVIGIDNLHYGKVTADSSAAYTGSTPVAIPGMTEAGYNRNAQISSFFADNVTYCTAAGNGEIDGAFAVADVPPKLASDLYGDKYNAETGELLMGEMNPPDVFLQYRIKKSNGAWRYITLYKVKCAPVDQKVVTQGNSINFQTNGFTFKAAYSTYNGSFCRVVDDDDPNLPNGVTAALIAEKYFTEANWEISAS